MKQKGANTVVEGAENAFGTAVLLRRVRARETKDDAMCSKEIANGEVVKLFAVVRLETHDRALKLREHKSAKRS